MKIFGKKTSFNRKIIHDADAILESKLSENEQNIVESAIKTVVVGRAVAGALLVIVIELVLWTTISPIISIVLNH